MVKIDIGEKWGFVGASGNLVILVWKSTQIWRENSPNFCIDFLENSRPNSNGFSVKVQEDFPPKSLQNHPVFHQPQNRKEDVL
jgi:hypothetical protein